MASEKRKSQPKSATAAVRELAKRAGQDRVGKGVGRICLDGVEELKSASFEDARHALHVDLLACDARERRLELAVERFKAIGGDGGEVGSDDGRVLR